ncbi:hypothetical protein ZHAS_00006747 [Anopheles sinensis]|uniref:Uncharacterized protein n=1 Tax=Anopheles sinensis TaxID=74873 RepID=A0A084VM42_ANOSI|nr:hypothetical protein ZHAS_00006747 [Anopheles sinensis]
MQPSREQHVQDFLLKEDDALPPPSLALLSTALATLVDSARQTAVESPPDAQSLDRGPSGVEDELEVVASPALIVHCICDFFVDL